jgi:hypothetical protein
MPTSLSRGRATKSRKWSPITRRTGQGALALAMAATAVVAGTAGPASAGTLPPSLQKFAHCPISNPNVTLCVAGSMTGNFTVGSQTLTATKPATLSLGLAPGGPNGLYAVDPTDGTPALKSPPIPVSILGLPGLPSPLSITATPQLLATPNVNFLNLLTAAGPSVGLSLDVHLNNVLLGSNCTIGNASDPLNIDLTDGTTNPPPPNVPVTGNKGTLVQKKNSELIDSGVVLVDNAFSVPSTYGCGLLGILDPVLNGVVGLPSPAGKNSATFSGTTWVINASVIAHYLG